MRSVLTVVEHTEEGQKDRCSHTSRLAGCIIASSFYGKRCRVWFEKRNAFQPYATRSIARFPPTWPTRSNLLLLIPSPPFRTQHIFFFTTCRCALFLWCFFPFGLVWHDWIVGWVMLKKQVNNKQVGIKDEAKLCTCSKYRWRESDLQSDGE